MARETAADLNQLARQMARVDDRRAASQFHREAVRVNDRAAANRPIGRPAEHGSILFQCLTTNPTPAIVAVPSASRIRSCSGNFSCVSLLALRQRSCRSFPWRRSPLKPTRSFRSGKNRRQPKFQQLSGSQVCHALSLRGKWGSDRALYRRSR